MTLDKAMKSLKFDTRMLEFNLRTGILSKEELVKYLEELPDCSENGEPLELQEKNKSLKH